LKPPRGAVPPPTHMFFDFILYKPRLGSAARPRYAGLALALALSHTPSSHIHAAQDYLKVWNTGAGTKQMGVFVYQTPDCSSGGVTLGSQWVTNGSYRGWNNGYPTYDYWRPYVWTNTSCGPCAGYILVQGGTNEVNFDPTTCQITGGTWASTATITNEATTNILVAFAVFDAQGDLRGQGKGIVSAQSASVTATNWIPGQNDAVYAIAYQKTNGGLLDGAAVSQAQGGNAPTDKFPKDRGGTNYVTNFLRSTTIIPVVRRR